MKTTGAILILSFACLNLLFLQSTVSGTNATEGVCFKNFKENFGCKRVIRGRAIRGKKITFYDCCSKYNGAGWATKRKDRRSCTSCPKWSEWSDYSPCPVTCGISNKVRTRICHGTQQKGGPYCKGDSKEYKKCIGSVPNCPIHGGWSNWTKWSACSKTCEEGLQTRARTCDNPVPKYGGNMCVGQNNDIRNCTERQKCPIDGGWGRWGPWSQCSRACGIGNKTRTRPCNNPKPQFGGKPCPKSQGIAIWLCRLSKCPPTAAPSNSGSGSGVLSESSGFVAASGSGSDSSSGESGGGSGDVWSSIRKKRAAGLFDDEDY